MTSRFRSSEQAAFYQLVARHISNPDAPLLLEGGTGIGKTRAYLAAAVAAGKRIAIVLPTHALIDQLLASDDLAQVRADVSIQPFRPARMFETRKQYEEQRTAARQAQIMVCTAASVIIDNRLGGEYHGATVDRDYLLFDEADQLPDMAALQSDFTITREQLSELGIVLTTPEYALRDILAKKPHVVDPEVRAAAAVMLEALLEPKWYQACGLTDDDGLALTHRLPGRLLKKVANRPGVAFISATLTIGGKFNDFRNALGIEKVSELSTTIEPSRHGTLDFTVVPLEVDTAEWLQSTVAAVRDAAKPVLVATTSHEFSERIGEQLPGAIVRDADTPPRTAAEQAADGILISAGAWAGLDTPTRWRTIIVPRVPFGQPVVIDGEVTTSYLDARNVAIRRLRQVIGRGLRSPDAVCSITILDQRVEKLSGFIPQRFSAQWNVRTYREGRRIEVVLSKAERDPAVRRAALLRHGRVCMGCGFKPTVDSQLDVHHLDPIAEGERKTTLDDVVVLCANCHRLAHAVTPPMPMEELRVILRGGSLVIADNKMDGRGSNASPKSDDRNRA